MKKLHATRVCLSLLLSATPAAAATLTVPAGSNLQQAIDSASPGDTIALAPGATFNRQLHAAGQSGDAAITIRTSGDADCRMRIRGSPGLRRLARHHPRQRQCGGDPHGGGRAPFGACCF